MSLFDLISGKITDFKYRHNMPKITQDNPVFTPTSDGLAQNIQIDTPQAESGTPAFGNRLRNMANAFGTKLSDALLGKQEKPTDNINDNTSNPTITTDDGQTYTPNSAVTVSNNPRVGGILRDITSGYHENRTTPISLDNFGQNELPNNRTKGFAYRLGEGLGSMARFAESPLGRSLLVGGTIGALGGSPAEALTFGVKTGALNQGYRTNDKLYRDDLIATQQQALRNSGGFNELSPEEQQAGLDAIANNINGLRGYLTQDAYKNLINTQQLRDNADWKKMYFDTNQENLEANREWQRKQAEIQRGEKAADRAFQYYKANLDHQDRVDALDAKKNSKATDEFADIEQQLNNFQATFKDLPNKMESYTLGNLRAVTGAQTEKEANFNAQRTLLFNQIARKLGGEKGVLSDADIKRIEAALPTLYDSNKQKMAKMQAVYDLLDIKRGQTPRSQTFTSGKYKVTVKG